ncbi:hypothetical protein [Nocardia sp. alder85J]|uniref:hypothetical protein n=1 Tax=Nocardia sp. alder85J TaxID=2862949 RepID=UPI001CD3BBE2|nr:hypothetical protein [Nocardia sp. alder85J]MCX4091969.1 hypothetical protein [Nocardia sp. alder85J]
MATRKDRLDRQDPLALHYDYSQLNLADLLRARDAYHFHLMNKANVIGTAIGYYLVRDDGDRTGRSVKPNSRTVNRIRTFGNSSVRDYSWPCVLVLVSRWEDEEEFSAGGRYSPAQLVPKTLFLPDGQAVPVCVVQAEPDLTPEPARSAPPEVRPAWKLGGGMPLRVFSQGVDHLATAGCLVGDGHYLYALTAAHVCGDPQTPVTSMLRGGPVPAGHSDRTVGCIDFATVYPDFPSRRSLSSVDAGLIRLDDANAWTSNIYGLPPLGPIEDVHERNVSLRIIDRRVVGHGAASGLLSGRIKALFYRYRSVGGFDYIGDFLISPEGASTRHGDSGMVWCLDLTQERAGGPPAPLKNRDLRPLAMEWGGQPLVDGHRRSTFAVATNLSTVCRLLNVELVNDISRGVSGYWGRVGHYSIATFATQLVENATLKAFLTQNLDLLSFDLDTVGGGATLEKLLADREKTGEFVPAADVPDEIWKKRPPPARNGRVGGRDDRGTPFGSDGPEHPNHYADIDDPYPPTNSTWRQQCLDDPDGNITADAWQRHYTDIAQYCQDNGENDLAQQYRDPLHQGLLPLRVWQLFEVMVSLLHRRDIPGFLTAAGVCAHYVGDGSQPLHGSVLADGDPRRLTDRLDARGHPAKFGEGSHSAYESQMVTRKASDLMELITGKLPVRHGLPLCHSGKDAAHATLTLMDGVAGVLPPRTILECFEKHLDDGRVHVSTLDAMWEELGDQTADVMLRGACALAMIWESAWAAGAGDTVGAEQLGALDPAEVQRCYTDPHFAPSLTLAGIGPELRDPGDPPPS